jgi:hypothetical protein
MLMHLSQSLLLLGTKHPSDWASYELATCQGTVTWAAGHCLWGTLLQVGHCLSSALATTASLFFVLVTREVFAVLEPNPHDSVSSWKAILIAEIGREPPPKGPGKFLSPAGAN